MIWVIKAKKSDRLLLLDYKLKVVIPYINKKEDKLQAILYINNYIKDNYNKGYIIWYNFQKVGAFIKDDEYLDLLYIEDKYRNKKIGSKILKKLKDIKYIKVRKDNIKALKFYENRGFIKDQSTKDIIILKRRV